MEAKKLFLIILSAFLLAVLRTTALAEVVYDNTSTVVSSVATTEVGDTVNLAGTARFINSVTVGITVGSSDYGKTEVLRLRFYLPNAPGGCPGRLIWQSAPLTYVTSNQNIQLVTFNVPDIRVPNTFIWCVEHANFCGFALANPPTVGSSPSYAWTNLTKFSVSPPCNFLARIEARSRPDAVLLGKADDDGWFGLGTGERYNMKCYIRASGLEKVNGPAFAGLTEWDIGTFPFLCADDYAKFVEVLTNGQNDSISVGGESTGSSYTEQSLFVKSPGIAAGYPDFHGCHITDITLAVNNIIIDHSMPDWTYFTWDVTWEIWGHDMAADFNKDEKVNFEDYAILAGDWLKYDTNSVADISGPAGIFDNQVDKRDLDAFRDYWLKDTKDPNTW
jgi:hypothetical protein